MADASSVVSQVSNAANQVSGSVSSALSGLGAAATTVNKQLNGLSSNTWLARGDDKLVTKDAYTGIDGKSMITGVQNLLAKADLSFSDLIRGGKWVAGEIPTLTSLAKQGVAVFSQKGLVARVLSASSLTQGALSKLSAGATDGLLKQVKDFGQVYASMNGVVQQVGTTNFNDMNAVGGLINQWTGNTGIFKADDQDGAVGFVSGLVHDATSYGIPNSFGALASRLENTNLVSQVANRVLPSITASSDYGSLFSIGNTLGDKAALAMNPSIVSDFSFQYSIPDGTAQSAYGSLYSGVTGAFKAVDSSWDTGSRATTAGDAATVNLTSLTNGSSDLFTIVNQGAAAAPANSTEQLYSLASVLKDHAMDPSTSLQQSFPQTVYTPNTLSSQSIVDPIQLSAGVNNTQDAGSAYAQSVAAQTPNYDAYGVDTTKPGYKYGYSNTGQPISAGAIQNTLNTNFPKDAYSQYDIIEGTGTYNGHAYSVNPNNGQATVYKNSADVKAESALGYRSTGIVFD